jgi:DNA-binding response OmpR family regulator
MALRTFIFDDDELIRKTLSFFLKSEGYEVYDFPRPDLCPYYLDQQCECEDYRLCADVFITDLNMPGESGIDFVEKQIRNGCKVKNIAVMSADWDSPAIEHAKALGCKIFQKPFSIIELRDWLAHIKVELQKSAFPAQLNQKKKSVKETTQRRKVPRLSAKK